MEKLYTDILSYIEAAGISATTFGLNAVKRPQFVHQLRDHVNGKANYDPRWSTIEAARKYMTDNPAEESANG